MIQNILFPSLWVSICNFQKLLFVPLLCFFQFISCTYYCWQIFVKFLYGIYILPISPYGLLDTVSSYWLFKIPTSISYRRHWSISKIQISWIRFHIFIQNLKFLLYIKYWQHNCLLYFLFGTISRKKAEIESRFVFPIVILDVI